MDTTTESNVKVNPSPELLDLRRQLIEAFEAQGNETEPETREEVKEQTPEAAVPEKKEEAPAQPEKPTPGEPYQTKDGWQVDIPLESRGTQTFKAKTLKELIGIMGKAQENATRKIAELHKKVVETTKAAPKPEPKKKYEPKELTEEEQFMLVQELQTDPAKAYSKLMEATVGANPEEIRNRLQRLAELEEERLGAIEIQKFISATPDYVQSQKNSDAVMKYMQDNGFAMTKENLETAWEELKFAALVDVSEPTKNESAPTPTRKRAIVGISPRQADHVEEELDQDKPFVDEFDKLSAKEQKRRIESMFARQQRRSLR